MRIKIIDHTMIPIEDEKIPFISADETPPPDEKGKAEPGCNWDSSEKRTLHLQLGSPIPPKKGDKPLKLRLSFANPPKYCNNCAKRAAPPAADPASCSEEKMVMKYHNEALRKVGFGKFHVFVILTCGLTLGTHLGEMCAMFLILPSVALEFCLTQDQVNLLIATTFGGAAFGSLIVGPFVEINDRKLVLITCTSCMTLFALVSAFMPTFVPFIIVRCWSSICGGGLFTILVAYMAESIPRVFRARSYACFMLAATVGGLIAAVEFNKMLPKTEESLMLDQRANFRSWRHFLLFLNITTIMPFMSMFALPESPLWLLSTGRQWRALRVYARMYRDNRKGKELVVPNVKVPNICGNRDRVAEGLLSDMIDAIAQLFHGFGMLLRPPYLKKTCILTTIWFAVMFIMFGQIHYVLRMDRINEEQNILSKRFLMSNYTYENVSFGHNLINQDFFNTRFLNCTFDQTILSRVQFMNCTFRDTYFHGVQSAHINFMSSMLSNVKFIDTDITVDDFTDCTRLDTEFHSMSDRCIRQVNFNLLNEVDYVRSHIGLLFPSLLIPLWASCAMRRYGHARITTIALTLATAACFTLSMAVGEENSVFWVVGTVMSLIVSALVGVIVYTVHFYNIFQRCTVLGICFCFANLGALVGIWVFAMIPSEESNIAAVLSVAVMFTPTILSALLRDGQRGC